MDADSQLIVTKEVSSRAKYQGQLPRLLDTGQTHCGHTPNRLLADAGCHFERDLRELGARGVDGYEAQDGEGRAPSGQSPADRLPGAYKPSCTPSKDRQPKPSTDG